ncbi:MAG: T9SS type A sorting domain-containing protein [Bacteroidia bacterium]|nr:T9SS type A sorting domain-containing protein [Bacteroidia bacterium]
MRQLTISILLALIGLSTIIAQNTTLPLSDFCVPAQQDYVITGARNAAYIYEKTPTAWVLQQSLSIADADPFGGPVAYSFIYNDPASNKSSDGFGEKGVAISGDLAYVGFTISALDFNSCSFCPFSYWEDQTYVYKRTGNSWSVVNSIKGLPQQVQGQTVAGLYTRGNSNGFANLTQEAFIHEIDALGMTSLSKKIYTYNWDEQFFDPYIDPNYSFSISPSEDLVSFAVLGDPILLGSSEQTNKVWRKTNGIWNPDGAFTPASSFANPGGAWEGSYEGILFNFGDLLIPDFQQGYYSYQNGQWIYTSGLTSNILAAPTLSKTGNKAFVVDFSWNDVVRKSGYAFKKTLIGSSQTETSSLCQYENSISDTVLNFGSTYEYQVDVVLGNISAGSNVISYSLPATIQDLELSYECYDAQTDLLTWSVYNPNGLDYPFIFAQWWSNQRDTLWASANGITTFKTKNNPQNAQTYGDDNITGIWWINEDLLPGQPFDLVSSGIDLNQTCPANRMSQNSAEKAGSLFKGSLGKYMGKTGPDARSRDLLEVSFSLSPNPVSDFLIIDGLEGAANIEVFNQQGQLVLRTSREASPLAKISMKDMSDGIYTVKVVSNGMILSEKILKN